MPGPGAKIVEIKDENMKYRTVGQTGNSHCGLRPLPPCAAGTEDGRKTQASSTNLVHPRRKVAGVWCHSAILLAWARLMVAPLPAETANPYEYDISAFTRTDPRLVRFEEVAGFPASVEQPHGIATDARDGIYVCGEKAVAVLDPTGRVTRTFALEAPAGCIAVRDDDVLVGYRDHVAVFDRAGTQGSVWVGMGERAVLTALAVAANDVFVADAGSRVVWRFDRTGKLLGKIGDTQEGGERIRFIVPSPYFDVALGPKGDLWIANPGERRVENFSYDGKRGSVWGRSSMNVDGFPGCCNPIHIAIRPDGSFVTSEKGILRVKLYSPAGVFLSIVAEPTKFTGKGYESNPNADCTVPGPSLDLAVDSAGRVLVLDSGKGRVRVFVEKKNAGVR